MSFFKQIDFYGTKTELGGTLAVVYFSGWAWMNYIAQSGSIIEVAVTNFIAYSLFVWVASHSCGALLNPALTTLMLISKKIKLANAILYLTSQVVGSILAASILSLMVSNPFEKVISENGFVGAYNGFGKGGSQKWLVVTIYEALGSLFITTVYYLAVLSRRGKMRFQGMAVGAAYGCMILTFGAITGASCNPATIIGPAVIGHTYSAIVPYLLGQMIGAFLSGLVCEFVLLKEIIKVDVSQGVEIEMKEELNFVQQTPEFVRKDSFDDWMRGTVGDLDIVDYEYKKKNEMMDEKKLKNHAYNDSDEEGGDIVNKATVVTKRNILVNIDEENPLGEVEFEGLEDVPRTKGDGKRFRAPLSGVDGRNMPSRMVVTNESNGEVTEEHRVLPGGYKPSEQARTSKKADPEKRDSDESSSEEEGEIVE